MDGGAVREMEVVALQCGGCWLIFSEKISTRFRIRPELENALTLAHCHEA
jgi:hypothetical protein